MTHQKVTYRSLLFLIVLAIGTGQRAAYSQYASTKRIYEPVVITGDALSEFSNVPVDELFMFVYHSDTQTLSMIPFQIDERIYHTDPFNTARSRWFYTNPGESVDDTTFGLLSDHDELVFMVVDLGEEAPDSGWIDNDEAKMYQRLELEVTDNNGHTACGYLFRSSTITQEVPTPYDFTFDPETQTVETKFYSVGFDSVNGLIKDIAIKPPLGTGVDIFDTQKLRFIGLFDLGIVSIPIGRGDDPAFNERDNLYLYNEEDIDFYYLYYTKNPVVRLIREVRQTIRFGIFKLHEFAFYIGTRFYPYSGHFEGVTYLDPDSLKGYFETEDTFYIELDLLRQSMDYNESASSMVFFNKHNENILIDGIPDNVDKTIDRPIKEWSLTTGQQGSVFAHMEFADTSWQNISLYYHDNAQGGQGDATFIDDGGDTGDSLSYGDRGILFETLTQNSVNLDFGFTAYFIDGNLTKADGEALADIVENPVTCNTQAISYPTGVMSEEGPIGPADFLLLQNFPNPFNTTTVIRFSLPKAEYTTVEILDLQGRRVITLADRLFRSGMHELYWDGQDDNKRPASAGVYVLELRTMNRTKMIKMLLTK